MRRFLLGILSIIFLIPVSHAASSAPAKDALWSTMLESKVAYLRINAFTPEIARRVRPELQKLVDLKPRGLILDLRNNQGGEAATAHALLEALLPKDTPYMRYITTVARTLQVTRQAPVLKRSTPIVVLRNQRTVNEPDIVLYALQKIRRSGVLEFSPSRNALKRIYKQHVRMEQYRPIKEAVFFVVPDVRLIGDEGGEESDVIPRAISFIKELSPWDDVRKVGAR